MAVAGEVTGGEELQRALGKLPGNVPYLVINYGLLGAAKQAERLAKKGDAYFTDRTGALRKSIKAKQEQKRYGWNNSTKQHAGVYRFVSYKIGGAGAMHANQVELGNRFMKARAPIRRSVDDAENQMLDAALKAAQRRFNILIKNIENDKLRRETEKAAIGQ